MTTPAPPDTTPDATDDGPEPALFEVIRTSSGWKIDEDGRLYGEYANEAQALAAAGKAATALIEAGGKADITYGPVNRGKHP